MAEQKRLEDAIRNVIEEQAEQQESWVQIFTDTLKRQQQSIDELKQLVLEERGKEK